VAVEKQVLGGREEPGFVGKGRRGGGHDARKEKIKYAEQRENPLRLKETG
jgi:hypothetical protein